jgi:hypothetical protein
MTLSRPLHLALHAACASVALAGAFAQPSAVAPWVCLAAHVLGAATHRLESDADRDTEFLGIVRTSLGLVACLVAAGQHWVVGVTGVEYLALAASALVLEGVRPTPNRGT